MESWSRNLPLRIHPTVTRRQFSVAVTFLTLAGFLITYLEIAYLHTLTGYLLTLGIQAILLFNAFIPHIGSTIRFRMYSPGVVTATVVTIPFSFYIFRRVFMENILTLHQFWILLGISPIAMVIFAWTSLQIGKIFDK